MVLEASHRLSFTVEAMADECLRWEASERESSDPCQCRWDKEVEHILSLREPYHAYWGSTPDCKEPTYSHMRVAARFLVAACSEETQASGPSAPRCWLENDASGRKLVDWNAFCGMSFLLCLLGGLVDLVDVGPFEDPSTSCITQAARTVGAWFAPL